MTCANSSVAAQPLRRRWRFRKRLGVVFFWLGIAIPIAFSTLGRWDGSAMELSVVDWNNPDTQPICLLAGELGSVSLDGESFTADLHGAIERSMEKLAAL